MDFPPVSVYVSLSKRPYHPTLTARLPKYILHPFRADLNKFLLVG